jgi:7-cyano-7-deazaguanine synthase in queuosine biosynthesis
MRPVEAGPDPPLHCGLCSKCRERRDAFAALGADDPARYAAPSPR